MLSANNLGSILSSLRVLNGLSFILPALSFQYFGAGADLRLNHKMIIGIILQYHKPFEVKQEETADIRGSYAKLLLTAMYLF